MISILCDELSIALRQITIMVITLPTRRQCWVCHQSNIRDVVKGRLLNLTIHVTHIQLKFRTPMNT